MAIDLNQPQVAAAIVGGIAGTAVSVLVAVINQLSLRSMHRQKLDFDRDLAERRVNAEIALADRKITADMELAERRFEVDKKLAEHKVDLDIALAEKRLALDHELDIRKRRTGFAEEVLADFYQARDIINDARTPVSFGDEGSSRPRDATENPDDARQRDTYYTVIERLTKKAEFFAQFRSRRYRFFALFGTAAGKPYDDLFKIRQEIVIAVQTLIRLHGQPPGTVPNEILIEGRNTIWALLDKNDPIPGRLDRIVEVIEKTCRPVIQGERND
jgi:gas vesicle protein